MWTRAPLRLGSRTREEQVSQEIATSCSNTIDADNETGIETHCWEVTFEIPENEGMIPITYDVKASHTGDIAGSAPARTLTVPARPADAKDKATLEAIYDSTGGDGWTNNDNWGNEWFVTATLNVWNQNPWHGVTIGDAGDDKNRVTGLDLSTNALSPRMPAAVGDLERLRVLSLTNNGLHGEIPEDWASLILLETLELFSNNLTGTIPEYLGELGRLMVVDLSSNKWANNEGLSGRIPAKLGNLTNLRTLDLSKNQLSGPIPTDLGKVTTLRHLDLSDNNLRGAIPEDLGKLTNLEELYLSGNKFDGCIPVSLRGLAKVEDDLGELGLPYCDAASLNALAVTPGELKPRFSVSQTSYSADVPQRQATISATANANGTVQFLGEDNSAMADADGEQAGHQVHLSSGFLVVKVRATSQDGQNHLDYTVHLTLAGGEPGAPVIDGVTARGSTLTVGWTAPEDTGTSEIAAYHLRYIEGASSDQSEANWNVVQSVWEAGRGNLSYGLKGLELNTGYDVQVQAENDSGPGPWSDTATGTTEQTPELPTFETDVRISDRNVYVDESFTVTVKMRRLSGDAGHGGMTISFPTLYNPVLGSVSIDSYTNGTDKVHYLDKGQSPIAKADGTTGGVEYPVVQIDDTDWPLNEYRTVELTVTPKRNRMVHINVRGWMCRDGYDDCAYDPDSGPVDQQQGWHVDVRKVLVRNVPVRNYSPVVEKRSPLANDSIVLDTGTAVSATFEAYVFDRDGNLSSCQWRVTLGSTEVHREDVPISSSSASIDLTYTFKDAGTHQVNVTCSDTNSRTDSETWEVLAGSGAFTVSEGDGTVDIAVTLGAPASEDRHLELFTIGVTAVGDRDYQGFSERISFPAGTTWQTVTLTIFDDTVLEAAMELFWLRAEGQGFVTTSLIIRLLDNDTVELGFDSDLYHVLEGDANHTLCVRNQTPTGINLPIAVFFSYSDPVGALAAVSQPSPFLFEEGDTRKCIDLYPSDVSTVAEVVFTLTGANDSRVTFGRTTTTLTVLNADQTVSEDDGSVDITVILSEPAPENVRVLFFPADDTAASRFDYQLPGPITIPAGTTWQTVTVPIVDDGILESRTEEFSVNAELYDPVAGLTVSTSPARISILDDDNVELGFEGDEYWVPEGSGNHPPLCIVADHVIHLPIAVSLSHNDPNGALVSGSVPSSVVVGGGDIRHCIAIDPSDVSEDAEVVFTLTGTDDDRVTFGQSTTTVKVFDVDQRVSESDGTVGITITLDAPSSETSQVRVSFFGGTARSPDVTFARTIVTFPPNITSQTLQATIHDDPSMEHDEFFILWVQSHPEQSLLYEIVVVIHDDDGGSEVGWDSREILVSEDRTFTICMSATDSRWNVIPFQVWLSYEDPVGALSPGVPVPSFIYFSPHHFRRCFALGAQDVTGEAVVTFTLTGTSHSRVTIGESTSRVTVQDRDPPGG